MNHFEAAPQILLYAYFPHKAEFDFSQETYETPVVFLLTAGSFRFRFGDGKPATGSSNPLPCRLYVSSKSLIPHIAAHDQIQRHSAQQRFLQHFSSRPG